MSDLNHCAWRGGGFFRRLVYRNTKIGLTVLHIICSSPDVKAQCKKIENALKCLFNYLDKLKGSSDCEQD
ncbi:hypothetical protein AVEN_242540-1 [Araneus ventricosus]|uniref:Uncharacterized protein n=1 Tax=Araneus ventricosus TaxID=182803 RepID=A0A4Y2W7K4_ARAVE|nr:hypothetical protein AVEN_242540-1 [Araneus ventricosus]